MTTYTPQQLRVMASNAGFRDGDDVIMAAIILGESGGDERKLHKNNNGSTDYGLAQINSTHLGKPLGDSFLAGKLNTDNVLDPTINLAFAHLLYLARGGPKSSHRFDDWVVYTNGTYKTHLPAVEATDPVNSGGIVNSIENTIENAAKPYLDAVGKYAMNGALIGLAIVLIILAVVILIGGQKAKMIGGVVAGAGRRKPATSPSYFTTSSPTST